MNEFRATLCFGCRHRGEAEGKSRCFHPDSGAEQRALLRGEVGPLAISVAGFLGVDFEQAYPNGFNELAIQSCNGQTRLGAVA